MEDDNMCIVYDLDSANDSDFAYTDKPILNLIRRLIHGEHKQNTVLTNAQLVKILQKEFDIDVKSLHVLEEEIYLTIMKKFLKDWPEWDGFDKNLSKLKDKPPVENKKIFEENYSSLKNYLKSALEIATPLAKKKVQTVGISDSMESDVVLEIEASRDQLNNLFFRHPVGSYSSKTIFNITPTEPSQIKVFTPSLQSILNWWGVNIYIYPADTNVCIYKRESKHELQHVLVNKKLAHTTQLKTLDQQLKFKGNTNGHKYLTTSVIETLKKLCEHYSTQVKSIEELFDFIQKDMLLLPNQIYATSNYRRYTNKYPYVRYLYEDVKNAMPDDVKNYDIQLEETISPVYQLYLGNVDQMLIRKKHCLDSTNFNFVIVECSICCIAFKSVDLISELKTHFGTYHQNEVDFKCTNCKKEFAIEALSQNWWCHKC